MQSLQAKFLRFAIVGVANGLIYAVSTSCYISQLGIGSTIASILGYLTAIPFAFFAHRSYTFKSSGLLRIELGRFIVTHATGLVVSVFAMEVAVGYLGLHYAVGIVVGILLVPIVTFLVFDNWVFVEQAKPRNASGKTGT